MATVVQQRDVPQEILALDPLGSDYVDLFVARVDHASATPPEQWARAAIEGAPPAGRFMAWRLLLALRLEDRPSSDRIGGWRIVGRGDDWIRVRASSWCMTAQMVFRTADDQLSFATFVRYDRAVARALWTPVSAIHRRVAPGFLAGTVRRVNRSRR